MKQRLSEMAAKFEVEFIGRGPRHIRTIIIEDLIIIIRQRVFLVLQSKNWQKIDLGRISKEDQNYVI